MPSTSASPEIREPEATSASAQAALGLLTATSTEDVLDRGFLGSRAWPAVDSAASEVTVVDLFCGCGGMTLGVWEAARRSGRRLRSLLACDVSEAQLSVYAANFGEAAVRREDLSEVSSLLGSAPTPVEIRLFRPLKDQRVDFLLAGPPCQGHSNLNNHTRRRDPKNELYLKVARAAEILVPTNILIENVPGVLRDHGTAVQRTVEGLLGLGYSVHHEVVDLTKIGVAQTRKRHMLVATRAPVEQSALVFERLTASSRVATRSLSWAIADLVDREGAGIMNEVPEMAEQTRQRVDYLFDHGLYDLPDTERPDCHRTKPHSYQAVYGRMRWDLPAPTLTNGFMTVGRGRFVHPDRRRTLTPHEAARVQFFPDFFDFSPLINRKTLTEAIGNAVPPKMSMVFAQGLLRLQGQRPGRAESGAQPGESA